MYDATDVPRGILNLLQWDGTVPASTISGKSTPHDAPLTLVEIRHERSELVGLLESPIAHLDEV
jgi:hypothetical protein